MNGYLLSQDSANGAEFIIGNFVTTINGKPITLDSQVSAANHEASNHYWFNVFWSLVGYQRHLAVRNPHTGNFSNIPVKSTEHAAVITERSVRSGHDVYYCPALFLSSENRKSDNAFGVNSFWLDIDVSENKSNTGKGYGTIEEANTELKRFCAETKLPAPTHIVNSGTGLHVYWALTTVARPSLWKYLALQLKALCKHHNFYADPSRTADIASLMRVPGTLNHKYSPPRPVTLVYHNDQLICREHFANAITAAHQSVETASPTEEPNSKSEAVTSIELAYCEAALNHLDPDMPYADWFKVGAVLFNHSTGSAAGYVIYDQWSRQGEKYKGKSDTRKVWRSIRPDHPRPVKIGTIRMMVTDAGYDWDQDVVAVAESKLQEAKQ